MPDLTYTVGDTGPTLTGNVSANLTGATAAIHILKPDGATVISQTAQIITGTNGAWSYDFGAGDINQTGYYTVEIQVTFSSGKIQTFNRTIADGLVQFYAEAQIA